MKEKTQIEDCQFKCGGKIDWMVCDEEGENCSLGVAVQCGHCGMLNTTRPLQD